VIIRLACSSCTAYVNFTVPVSYAMHGVNHFSNSGRMSRSFPPPLVHSYTSRTGQKSCCCCCYLAAAVVVVVVVVVSAAAAAAAAMELAASSWGKDGGFLSWTSLQKSLCNGQSAT
jgi:hypothetical protein